MTPEEADQIRADLVAAGPTPCAELNLMVRLERLRAQCRDAIAKLETLRERLAS